MRNWMNHKDGKEEKKEEEKWDESNWKTLTYQLNNYIFEYRYYYYFLSCWWYSTSPKCILRSLSHKAPQPCVDSDPKTIKTEGDFSTDLESSRDHSANTGSIAHDLTSSYDLEDLATGVGIGRVVPGSGSPRCPRRGSAGAAASRRAAPRARHSRRPGPDEEPQDALGAKKVSTDLTGLADIKRSW